MHCVTFEVTGLASVYFIYGEYDHLFLIYLHCLCVRLLFCSNMHCVLLEALFTSLAVNLTT